MARSTYYYGVKERSDKYEETRKAISRIYQANRGRYGYRRITMALEEEGIYVSAGSACSSNKRLPVSPVLEKMGLPREEAESALRFSFSELNTTQEVEICLKTLEKLVPMLRRYSRR